MTHVGERGPDAVPNNIMIDTILGQLDKTVALTVVSHQNEVCRIPLLELTSLFCFYSAADSLV